MNEEQKIDKPQTANGIKQYVMLSLPSGDEEIQEFINKSEARRTFQGTPCFAQERLAFDSAVRETIRRLRERGNGA